MTSNRRYAWLVGLAFDTLSPFQALPQNSPTSPACNPSRSQPDVSWACCARERKCSEKLPKILPGVRWMGWKRSHPSQCEPKHRFDKRDCWSEISWFEKTLLHNSLFNQPGQRSVKYKTTFVSIFLHKQWLRCDNIYKVWPYSMPLQTKTSKPHSVDTGKEKENNDICQCQRDIFCPNIGCGLNHRDWKVAILGLSDKTDKLGKRLKKLT